MKKIPIGIQDLQELREGGYFYVDKTEAIYNLLSKNKYFFLSRPRRFGKSLTLSTMKYLYMGKKELFKDTWIYDKWDFTKTSPVLHLSFAGFTADQDMKEYIKKQFKVFIGDEIRTLDYFDNRFELDYILHKIFNDTGKKTAIIIDEYDKGVLVHLTDVVKAEAMRDFFTSFYSGVKDSDPFIELFMLTGLTKVLKMSVFSVLNNLEDISYDSRSYALMGYTLQELRDNFSPEIAEVAKEKNLSVEETLNSIITHYNGYNFGNPKDTIFNPWNINNFCLKKEFNFYWADTGIPSTILNYIKKNQIDVKDLIESLNEDLLRIDEIGFKLEDLTRIKAEVLFTNSGYLTVKKFDKGVYTLGYPNEETEKVMTQFFVSLLEPSYNFSVMERIASGLYEGITTQNSELLGETFDLMINKFLSDTAYEWINKNPEGWFKTFLGMFLRLNNIYYYPEVQNLKGRKDLVIPVNNKYYIVEAKVDGTCEAAIAQIDKKYMPQFPNADVVKVAFNWKRQEGVVEVVMVEAQGE